MLLYQSTDADGQAHSLRLDDDGGVLRLRREDGLSARLPGALIVKLMRRYGRELEADIDPDGERLALGDGHVLQAFRWRAGVDAIGRDYLALRTGEDQPVLACLATQLSAALDHLLERAPGDPSP